jgi:hypothetical protein
VVFAVFHRAVTSFANLVVEIETMLAVHGSPPTVWGVTLSEPIGNSNASGWQGMLQRTDGTMTDLNEFTDEELRQFDQARDALRAVLPSHGFIHTDPMRNPSGVLTGVIARASQDGPKLAEVAIRSDGTLGPVRLSGT